MTRRTGAVIGTTMNRISKVSRKKPRTKMIAKTIRSAPVWPPGIPSRKPRTMAPPPSWVNTRAKAVAPSRITNTIEVIDIVTTQERNTVSK